MTARIAVGQKPERPSRMAVLGSCDLFGGLTWAEREQIVACSPLQFAGRGELIVASGEAPEFAGVVGTGFAKKSRTTAQGHDVALELLGPGQCFGLLSMIEGQPCQMSTVAVTACWYLKIPRSAVIPILSRNPGLTDQLLRSVIPRLRRAHDMMARLSSGRVESRLAAILFLLAASFGTRQGEGICVKVPLTRQDLSELAGTTVETTIRIMSRWQKQGLVRTLQREITILDEVALAEALSAA